MTTQIHVDYQQPPATLEKMFEKAEAVVLARIVGRAATVNGYFRPVTDYSVIVIEKFKGDGSIPAKGPGLNVRRTGDLTKNIEVGFPLFSPGEQYVLFLKYRRDMEGLSPMFGPDGALKLDSNGLMAPLGRAVSEIEAKYKVQRQARRTVTSGTARARVLVKGVLSRAVPSPTSAADPTPFV